MSRRRTFYLCLAVGLMGLTAAKPANEISTAKSLPDGVAKEIAATFQTEGHQVEGEKGVVCTVWLAKSLNVKAGFKPTLNVKYPFATGQLVGLLQVTDKSKFTDFRGQEIKPGVYTLRYGRQPEDGNHIGTSETYDFLCAVPVKDDTDPKPVDSFPNLARMSAKASGSTHPAIFSLLPVEKPSAKPALEHDEDRDLWILNVTTSGKAGETDVPVPVRLVVLGVSAA